MTALMEQEALRHFPRNWTLQRILSPLGPRVTGVVVRSGRTLLGAAWDISPSRAISRSVGEAVERWALRDPPAPKIQASAADLGNKALDVTPAAFDASLVSADYHWAATTEIEWATGLDSTGRELLVPLDLVWLRSGPSSHVRIRPATSIGTAAATDVQAARRGAINEALERHRVALAWRSGEAAREVEPLGSDSMEIATCLARTGSRLRVGLLPTTGMAVAIAIVEGNSSKLPAISAGSAARSTIENAVDAAAREALGTWHFAAQTLRRQSISATDLPRDAGERAKYWARAHDVDIRGWFTGDRSTSSINVEIGPCSFHDLTGSAPIPGIYVGRVVAPMLEFLQIDERLEHASCRQRGLWPSPHHPYPHPFV